MRSGFFIGWYTCGFIGLSFFKNSYRVMTPLKGNEGNEDHKEEKL
jgi:hypothetical protein